jgi:hypothetical protein
VGLRDSRTRGASAEPASLVRSPACLNLHGARVLAPMMRRALTVIGRASERRGMLARKEHA